MIFNLIGVRQQEMSTTLCSFNLTDYTDLRSLEFEYSKLQDENQTLKFKLQTLENLYRKVIKQSQLKEKLTREKQMHSKEEEGNLKQKIREVLDGISQIKCQLVQLDKLGIDCRLGQLQNTSEVHLESAPSELSTILNVLLSLMNRNSQLSLNYSREVQTLKAQNRLYRKDQQDFKEEITYLSQEVNKLEKINGSIANELNKIRRENADLKLKLYQFAQDHQQTLSRVEDQPIEDNNFTVDLLHYQKQLLERTFEKAISAIQNPSISSILHDIYTSCESVAEIFREKLQIQYDLQDLEHQYKREKNTKVSEKLLIELRKQIEEFRSELQKQRELLGKEEMNLQELFLVLKAADKEQKMARNYAVDIQKQLQNIKESRDGEDEGSSIREVKMVKQTKRNSQDSSVRESSRIRFKASQNDEVIRQALERDRENIEKMFKQTRRNYLKQLQ